MVAMWGSSLLLPLLQHQLGPLLLSLSLTCHLKQLRQQLLQLLQPAWPAAAKQNRHSRRSRSSTCRLCQCPAMLQLPQEQHLLAVVQ
jgi:hypothetical protein